MRRMLMLGMLVGVAACWPDAEESSTAEELVAEDSSVIQAGTRAPDSVLTPAAADTMTRRDTGAADTAARTP